MSMAEITDRFDKRIQWLALLGVPVAVIAIWEWRLAAILLVWLVAWSVNTQIANRSNQRLVVAAIFGVTLLVLWEMVVQLYDVPLVILPPPSEIAAKFAASTDILWRDFVQTFVKGALSGYVIGCSAAVLMAVAVDRSPFLQAGLVPVGNFMAALPIIGTAPILVMWFGFGWQP